jgi:hypothetical protein
LAAGGVWSSVIEREPRGSRPGDRCA